MHVILDTVAPYMFLPFFVMTGAALKLDQVVNAIPLMSLYVVLRFVAIFIACYVGGRYLLKLTPRQYNNLWLTMTPQAGVALGLANEVKAMSDESWAAEFAATIVAAVVVNQIIGPVLCAMGLSRAGETMSERAADAATPKLDKESVNTDDNDPRSGGARMSISTNAGFGARPSVISGNRLTTMGNGDPRVLLPFYKVSNAVVIGDDEVAFEVALELSLYGAQVNVPLLDEELANKWQKMNETILSRTAKGDLITYKNKLQDRDNTQAMSSADVLIFTGDPNRTLENVHLLKSLLGAGHPRMIALVPDCKFSKGLKEQGVLVIQPSIALANIATRMALLDDKLAKALSNEISTTSDFSTASYFLRRDGGDLSDMRLEGRRLALGRSVITHHSVNYDRLAETLANANLPMPPPPSRVAMFGTSSAARFDPFAAKRDNDSDFFVVHDDQEKNQEIVVDAQYAPSLKMSLIPLRGCPSSTSNDGAISSICTVALEYTLFKAQTHLALAAQTSLDEHSRRRIGSSEGAGKAAAAPSNWHRLTGAMQTISEDFVPLATPQLALALAPVDSSTSSAEDVIPDEWVDSSHEAGTCSELSDGRRPEESVKNCCGVSQKSVDKYLPVVMSVIIGAYFGVGVRVLLTEFANVMYESQTELLELLGFSFYLPNVVGCFVMGMATRIKPVLRGQYDVLLAGITTGFCGCCTTFASWDLGAALMFVRGKWLDALLMLGVHVASAIISLRLGFHVAEGIVHYFMLQHFPFRKPPINLGQLNLDLERNIIHFREIKMNTFGPLVARRVRATEESLAIARDSCTELIAEIAQVEQEQHPVRHHNSAWVVVALVLTALFWVLAYAGFGNYPSSRLLALCFGPFGALLRYYLSLYNIKPMCKSFPFFTFIPNVVASCLTCGLEIAGSITAQDGGTTQRTFVMYGQGAVMVGFLGSLSTVSTWVNELDGLSSRCLYWAYRYGLASVIVSQLASVFILGMYNAYGTDPLV
ncbi:hypothetical protein PHYBOEH_006231 [Phytophthora boehmeriae]|uniref:Cation/H+ exchanger domain-containing protein n=1 Tax=Phytophthora boehmeriae TaxID=109152 RepID=A0A8T1X3X5_9STRA|nr:hypothetical protein PHYBOEH_006231 [Phytophthora boehmeriae]